MREIPLTQGYVAIVDDEDYEMLSRFKWHARAARGRVYAITKVHGAAVRMHRMVFGDCKAPCVDHANRNSLDNRRHNLRAATCAQNRANAALQKSKTGYRGVGVRGKKFVATIGDPRDKGTYIGIFGTAEEAARARDAEAVARYGDFAVLNFPRDTGGNARMRDAGGAYQPAL
jgi:hypothetical protein